MLFTWAREFLRLNNSISRLKNNLWFNIAHVINAGKPWNKRIAMYISATFRVLLRLFPLFVFMILNPSTRESAIAVARAINNSSPFEKSRYAMNVNSIAFTCTNVCAQATVMKIFCWRIFILLLYFHVIYVSIFCDNFIATFLKDFVQKPQSINLISSFIKTKWIVFFNKNIKLLLFAHIIYINNNKLIYIK